tara:strand:+ start:734 stop:922 length:189 start_codon:yes stop_codon:yes gene_type:complete
MSQTIQFTLSDSLPILFLAFSMAFFDISSTVIFLYPFNNRKSTNLLSPPPISIIEESFGRLN